MIKIKTKYDYDENIFYLDKFIYKDSCKLEFLSIIHELIEELERQEKVGKKDIYKMIKDFDSSCIEEI